VRDPEFDQFDREHFEALLNLRADTCSCGGLLSETTVPDHGYEVEHVTCWRCWALAKNQADLAKRVEDDKTSTVIPSAEKWIATRIPLPNN
jgi:hypothetical protein